MGVRVRVRNKVRVVACPLAYAGDALGLRREERRRQGRRSNVLIGVGWVRKDILNVIE